MNLKDIINDPKRQMIFDIVLEEACRQWCAFFPDTVERMDGKGFANFFYEIFEQKETEYIKAIKDCRKEPVSDFASPENRPSVRKKLEEVRGQKYSDFHISKKDRQDR